MIYNREWYNGFKDNKDVHIANKNSILIGMPSMRQLRIKISKFSNALLIIIIAK